MTDVLELSASDRCRQRVTHDGNVGRARRRSLLRPAQKRVVGRSTAPRAEGVLDTPANAVNEARRRRARRADRTVRSRKRVDMLQRRPPLNAFRRTRHEKPRPNRKEKNEPCAGELQYEMTRRRSAEIVDDAPNRPGLIAVALMILIEHELRSLRTARTTIAEELEHPNRRDVRSPSTHAQYVVSKEIWIGSDDYAPIPERKADGRRTDPLRGISLDAQRLPESWHPLAAHLSTGARG